ncbi:MAG: Ig-like domain-containing protein, partial [Anaerolineales bacterium]|nr:Ig-like domain-containing protein [Anaerolineales bacterium]
MKLRFSTALLLAIVLIITSTVSVNASPDQQSTEDAIMQALNATAQELGLSARAEILVVEGVKGWAVNPGDSSTPVTQLIITENSSLFDGTLNLISMLGGQAIPVNFHGYTAYRMTFMVFVNDINGYYFSCSDDADTFEGAMRVAEVFYRHAVASGFMTGDGSVEVPTIETVVPELTLTPETGTQINLRAYAENYDQDTDFVDNSDNFGSVDISGRVTDLDTGAAIGGAVIEITSGAASKSTLSAADGSYSLTAVVSGVEGSGVIQGVDFSLPVNADLLIEVTPSSTELLADGTSTSDITIQVKDLQGNPLKDRAFDLEVSAGAGPGTIQPDQATTDENGVIQATYPAFKLEPGHGFSNPRHEVTISARDTATGLAGTNWIFVNQYQLSVQYGEYILACTRCTFPSEFTISVFDYWNNPIPNTPLTLRIEGGITGGTLVLDPNSTTSQQEITLTTDSSGRATAYYKWQGSLDITEAVQKVMVLEGATNAQVTKNVKVQGLDISLVRVEEAGFTGVTGHQAFLKVYFKERAHPDLPLDRFNADSPNKLGLRVTISQYHSDGVNTSLTYENYGGWERDEGGLFVKMYDTPHMPYVIPLNDGNSWYEIRVDPVTDHDIDLPDLFRPNNDTILVLKTGSPDGWLHIWLQDGILTPHSWAGVVFKCVGRFLPI